MDYSWFFDENMMTVKITPDMVFTPEAVGDDETCWELHDGFICNCVEGHEGPHVAWGSDDIPAHVWPQGLVDMEDYDDLE